MMRTLSTFLGTAAILMGLSGCIESPEDILSTVTSATLTQTTTDSLGTETGDPSGDGDGDGTTSGDGDGDPAMTGDGDGDASCGSFNAPCCEGDVCDDGLSCVDGVCNLGGGDGDGDGDPDPTTGGMMNESWDPAMCDPMDLIGVMGIEGNFCTNVCTMQGNEAAECAAAPPGTQAGCVLSDGMGTMFCALICQPDNDACPDGASCKDLMDPMNPGVGLCTYP